MPDENEEEASTSSSSEASYSDSDADTDSDADSDSEEDMSGSESDMSMDGVLISRSLEASSRPIKPLPRLKPPAPGIVVLGEGGPKEPEAHTL